MALHFVNERLVGGEQEEADGLREGQKAVRVLSGGNILLDTRRWVSG